MSKPALFKNIPAYLLVILLPTLVLIYDELALDPALHPRMFALGLFLLAAWPFVIKSERFSAALKTWPSILFLAFILFEGLSWLLQGARIEGSVPLLKDLGFYFLFITVSSQDWDLPKQNLLAWSATLSILLIAGFAFSIDFLSQWTGSFQDFPFTELRGRMAHHNLLASALVLLIPLVFLARKASARWLGYLAVIVALGIIVFTRSRSAVLAIAAASLVFGMIYFLRKWLPSLKLGFRSVGLTLSILLIPLLLVQYKLILAQTGEGKALQSNLLDTSTTEKNFTTGERLQMWDYSLAMIQDHDLFGVGPGRWRIEFPSYGSEVFRARQGIVQFQRPHNDYLWIWSEVGPFGLLFYLGFVLSIILIAIENYKRKGKRDQVLILAGFIALLVVSFFSFPRERIFHMSLFFLFAGLLNSGRELSSNKPLSNVASYILFGLGGFILFLFSLAGYQAWQGERISREMITAHGNANWNALLKLKAKTEALSFYRISPVGMPMEFYSGLAYLNLNQLDKALLEYKKASDLHPNNLQVNNNLANTYTLKGELDSALIYYQRAIEVSPFYKEGILNLASTYFNNGQAAEAYAVLREKAEEFDEDRELYESYVITIVRNLAVQGSYNLETLSDPELIRLHYILAYDIPQEDALGYFQSNAGNN